MQCLNKQKQSYRNRTPKHRIQINQVQSTSETSPDSPGQKYSTTSEKQINQMNCECTVDESETENTLIYNMLKREQEFEKPNESNYYQNDYTKLDLHESRNNQNNSKYTPHIIENNSNMNKKCQNAENKETKPEEKISIAPLLLESTNNFQQTDHEVDFLIDSGA